MTQIVKTGTRAIRGLVYSATMKSNTRRRFWLIKKWRMDRLGEEERLRRYEEVKAMNLRHGINPKKYRLAREALGLTKELRGQMSTRSKKKVTLPKVTV